MHAWLAITAAAVIGAGSQVTFPVAFADNPSGGDKHNVTYRASVGGVSRGLTITYNVSDTEVETATPTVLPGQIFEANAVLSDPKKAGMEISVRWPYTANLHCEILVDDQITAQADDFIKPTLLPQSSDPGYGVMPCGSELANAAAINAGNQAAGGNPATAPPSQSAPPPAPPP
ncbi:MAG: hypothetical protein QOH60_3762 [Mycobacterium sp.]|jgi:hypothetical protein|nr:hypothetical protein [Mycobacterium sp.]